MLFKKSNNKSAASQEKLFISICEEDTAPNTYALHGIWYSILVPLIFIALQLLHITVVDNDLEITGLLICVFILFLAEVFGYFTARNKAWLKYVIVFLVVIAVTIGGIYLTYHAILASVVPLLVAAQYSRRRVTVFAYILSIISIVVVVIYGYIYGLCDANMVIQTVSTTSTYGQYLYAEILPFSERWDTLLLFFALPRCLIITALIPMINAIVNNRKEILMRDLEIQYCGEHDHMTGLYNREKYSSLKEVYQKLDKVAVIYFDLNNLKLVNDTNGHEMGDKLIMRAADSIRSSLSDNMDAYRLGGDEFMVVIRDGGSSDTEAFVEKWQHKLKIINGLPGSAECQIAYGYASGSGRDLSEILKSADKNMYNNKEKSKNQN